MYEISLITLRKEYVLYKSKDLNTNDSIDVNTSNMFPVSTPSTSEWLCSNGILSWKFPIIVLVLIH